jgi:helix-turn-helix protein
MGRYAVPQGRIVKGWKVRLMPTPGQVARFKRDDGARRFAGNWAVQEIRRALMLGPEGGPYDSAVWSHYELRKRWNRVEPEVAPWWAECSKEAYSNGIADAVNALKNWHASKTGGRQGPGWGFPGSIRRAKTPFAARTPRGRCGSRTLVMWCCLALGGSGPPRICVPSFVTFGGGHVVCCRLPFERKPDAGAYPSGWRSPSLGSRSLAETQWVSTPGSATTYS